MTIGRTRERKAERDGDRIRKKRKLPKREKEKEKEREKKRRKKRKEKKEKKKKKRKEKKKKNRKRVQHQLLAHPPCAKSRLQVHRNTDRCTASQERARRPNRGQRARCPAQNARHQTNSIKTGDPDRRSRQERDGRICGVCPDDAMSCR